jgi:hypothetical protein
MGHLGMPTPRSLSAAILAATALGWVACGGAPSEGASSAASGRATAAQRCLDGADAKHARKVSEPYRIGVKHVLVRYAGARGAPATITRTREQACLRAEEALNKLKLGDTFGEVVGAYSDEPNAAAREGSIGSVQRSDVEAPFADAAFELQSGEVSDVVETPFGFHVILRTE